MAGIKSGHICVQNCLRSLKQKSNNNNNNSNNNKQTDRVLDKWRHGHTLTLFFQIKQTMNGRDGRTEYGHSLESQTLSSEVK